MKKINFLIKKGFIATDDFSKIRNVEAIIICVPTPLGNHKEPDPELYSFVVKINKTPFK